jgi:hypothetical protein
MFTLAETRCRRTGQQVEELTARSTVSIPMSLRVNGNLHKISLLADSRDCIVPEIPSSNIRYVNFTLQRNELCSPTSKGMAAVRCARD